MKTNSESRGDGRPPVILSPRIAHAMEINHSLELEVYLNGVYNQYLAEDGASGTGGHEIVEFSPGHEHGPESLPAAA